MFQWLWRHHVVLLVPATAARFLCGTPPVRNVHASTPAPVRIHTKAVDSVLACTWDSCDRWVPPHPPSPCCCSRLSLFLSSGCCGTTSLRRRASHRQSSPTSPPRYAWWCSHTGGRSRPPSVAQSSHVGGCVGCVNLWLQVKKHVGIIGCGVSGLLLMKELREKGHTVRGLG